MEEEQNGRLTKKQRQLINVVTAGAKWDEALAKLKVSPDRLRKWCRQEKFMAELQFADELKVLQSDLLNDANRYEAAEGLIAIMKAGGDETQRKACVDVLKRPTAFANQKQTNAPKRIEPLGEDRARSLLAQIGEKRKARINHGQA
ncbi:MAG: hypothetical protein LLF76_02440 [Planctomycetaceae bacterium]|nr:hypothetical protein [Planctomycetaceae bacterium]